MIPPPALKERLGLVASALLFLKEISPLGGVNDQKRRGKQVVG